MVTVGLDLHKRYITACATDANGAVLAEVRRLDPTVDALGRWLGALPQPLTVALEATGRAFPLYHRLSDQPPGWHCPLTARLSAARLLLAGEWGSRGGGRLLDPPAAERHPSGGLRVTMHRR